MYILIPPSVREFCEQIDWPINTFSITEALHRHLISLLFAYCDIDVIVVQSLGVRMRPEAISYWTVRCLQENGIFKQHPLYKQLK